MKKLLMSATLAGQMFVVSVQASWLSEITGVDIDLSRGTMEVKPPNPSAIGGMIQNLPKDAGQFMLAPQGTAIATAIRFSRGQAINRGVQPIPPNVKSALAPYFPPGLLDKVRWTTAGGISLDGALKNWFNQEGAITYDEVIVFSNPTEDLRLWAHELTHVLQYSQMGVETFAFQYSFDWNSLEGQTRTNSDRIAASVGSTNAGGGQTWQVTGQIAAPSQRPTVAQINNAARLAIPPQQCIWINNVLNITGNSCPVPIVVSGVVMVRLLDGFTFVTPCDQPTCLWGAGAQGPLLSPPGFMIVGVTAAYQF
ncbi:DUF4157 domain-containing protein [Achromobacter piechaudii]|uniref:UPF0033 domain-containing protein n=1 Tax=Achromobacter piechaudii ATCC 43553 TaxID=742159 RepID=D4XCQ4_9BURK|nr:DUF4157 domain-containing protein [Achromobacter piechaudii]EFF75440.1 hypothetical protein HMPREF0004_3251 [Achromobacter piechaudii ATCC 43553]